jgi:RNA polymerase sigma factor (sigma-70 family)
VNEALSIDGLKERENRLSEIIQRERQRLLNFIRKRVADVSDAEDIVQDVFSDLVESYELMKPVEQVGAWLYQVARNRMVDLFRRNKRQGERRFLDSDADQELPLEEMLPSSGATPDEAYVRIVLLDELDAALDELPEEQREVFLAHEIEGRSFKELAEATGSNLNTLLSRKRYAVLHLRKRLDAIYREFMNR